jgi:hypothetical protein
VCRSWWSGRLRGPNPPAPFPEGKGEKARGDCGFRGTFVPRNPQSPFTLLPASGLRQGMVPRWRGQGWGSPQMRYDLAVVTPRVEVEKDVDLGTGPRDVKCVLFGFKQAQKEGTIKQRIEAF